MGKKDQISQAYPRLPGESDSEDSSEEVRAGTPQFGEQQRNYQQNQVIEENEDEEQQEIKSKKRNRDQCEGKEKENEEKPRKFLKKDDCQIGTRFPLPQKIPQSEENGIENDGISQPIDSNFRERGRQRWAENSSAGEHRRKYKHILYLKNIPYFLQDEKKIRNFFTIQGCKISSILINGSYAEVEFQSRIELEGFIRKDPSIIGRRYIKYGKNPKLIEIKESENQARVIGQHKILNNITDQQWENMMNYFEKAIAPYYRFMLYLKKHIQCLKENDSQFEERLECDMNTCRNFKQFISTCGIILNQYFQEFQEYEKKLESEYSMVLKFEQDFDAKASLHQKQNTIRREFSSLFKIQARASNIFVAPRKKKVINEDNQPFSQKDTVIISCLSGRQFLLAYLYIMQDQSGKNRTIIRTPSVEKIQKIAQSNPQGAKEQIQAFQLENPSIHSLLDIGSQKCLSVSNDWISQPNSSVINQQFQSSGPISQKNQALEKLKQKLKQKKQKMKKQQKRDSCPDKV